MKNVSEEHAGDIKLTKQGKESVLLIPNPHIAIELYDITKMLDSVQDFANGTNLFAFMINALDLSQPAEFLSPAAIFPKSILEKIDRQYYSFLRSFRDNSNADSNEFWRNVSDNYILLNATNDLETFLATSFNQAHMDDGFLAAINNNIEVIIILYNDIFSHREKKT